MSHLTVTISTDGFALPIMVGLNGRETTDLVNKGQAVPTPVSARAVIDSGSDMTCIASRIAQQLGLVSIGQVQTHTARGTLTAKLYEASLGILRAGNLPGLLFVLEQVYVMELVHPPPNIEVLIGKDVLLQCLLIIDGPRGEFTIAE